MKGKVIPPFSSCTFCKPSWQQLDRVQRTQSAILYGNFAVVVLILFTPLNIYANQFQVELHVVISSFSNTHS